MRSIKLSILFLILNSICFSQVKTLEFEKKMEMKPKTENYNWFYRNVFLDCKVGFLSEVFLTPYKEYKYLKLDYPNDQYPDSITYRDANILISIANFAIEPRVNIIDGKKSSLFIKSPISLGLSIYKERRIINNINQNVGVFNFNVPLLLGFSTGLNSDFSNVKKRGFALSAGYQFLFTPLLGGKSVYTDFVTENIPVSEPYIFKKAWGMPLVQIDYYRLTKNKRINGYSLSVCPYGSFYMKFAFTFVLSKK